ncbi:hypothetical protein PAXINDRAFT_8836 [Paxillus involutus ATCC 200175]|nr:hypothetical protein PAXINDRAFT_8836 [Paxillus involutus ATCC 200175]
MSSERPRVEYVIFDMDGLLIGTEEIYTQVTNEILANHGVQMTWEMKSGLMGKVEHEAVAQLLSFFPGIDLTPEEYTARRTIGQDRLWPTVQPLPGVPKLVAHLANKGIPIVIATSSQRRNFLLKSANLRDEVFGYFGCGVEGKEEMVVCADDLAGKGSGKPDPYIFLCAAREKLVEHEAVAQLLSFFPGIDLTPEEYTARRTIGQDRLWPTVQPLPGVPKLVAHLANKGIPIVIATSSQRRNFLLKSANLRDEVFGYFGCGVEGKEEMVVCADDVAGKGSGKPDPYIFLCAAREKLGRNVGEGEGESVTPEQILERGKGLVFEDAIPGVQAGKRAGMSVVWVPDPNLLAIGYSGELTADQTLLSIEEFKPEEWGLPPYE